MKNQPSKMVTLEWLLPLVNQQLAPIVDGWQSNEASMREQVSQTYHQISGALIMANTPRLGRLAHCLSLLASADLQVMRSNVAAVSDWRLERLAHQLLHYELSRYVQTGSYRQALVDRVIDKLSQSLIAKEWTPSKDVNTRIDDIASSDSAEAHEHQLYRLIDIASPNGAPSEPLQPAQYHQLLIAWRQQTAMLLSLNHNDQSTLTHLATICRYLWQALNTDTESVKSALHSSTHDQQRLWYLSERWLRALIKNAVPTPKYYAAILSRLDQTLDRQARVADPNNFDAIEANKAEKNQANDGDTPLVSLSAEMMTKTIEDLIIDIYIQISTLEYIDSDTQVVLAHLSEGSHAPSTFLPHILNAIESIDLDIEHPQGLVSSLTRIKQQLARRGWSRYEQQIEQILSDVTAGIAASNFAQIQSSIEEQLQTLYSDIYHIEQSIRFEATDAVSDATNHDQSLHHDTIASDVAMRQLRINVEAVKHQFNDYIQHQKSTKLPSVNVFDEIAQTLDTMNLPSVRKITDQLAQIFATLIAHQIDTIHWQLTQALAESLTVIELLLDHLAQQVFDQALLAQADAYLETAQRLMSRQLSDPTISTDCYAPAAFTSKTATNVVRYDDSGEITASHFNDSYFNDDHVNDSHDDSTPDKEHDIEDNRIEKNNAAIHADNHEPSNSEDISDALQAVRNDLPADDFTIDDEIREVFIEEATEVLADLDDFIPIWQQDVADFSPLTEVRRGFHTLKGSGRMVGAFSIAEMAWAIENMLNRILDNTLAMTDDVVKLVTQSCEQLPMLVEDFSAKQPCRMDPAITVLQVKNVLAGLPVLQGINPSEANGVSNHNDNDIIDNQNTMLEPISTQADEADSRDSHDNGISNDSNAGNMDNQPVTEQLESIPAVLLPIIEAITPLPNDENDADPDIKEIFIEEASEVLAEITPLYEAWRANPTDLDGLSEIRRGFHTLKGSGRMVGAHYSAELAWTIENMLNRALDHTIRLSADMQQLITDVLTDYPDLVAIFAKDGTDEQSASAARYPDSVPVWAACATAYSKGMSDFNYQAVRSLWHHKRSADRSDRDQEAFSSPTDAQQGMQNVPLNDALQTMQSVNDIMAGAQLITAKSVDERAFCKIFIDEARGLLATIERFVTEHQAQASAEVSDEIVRAFHTLRAASGSSALSAISEVSATIEHSLEQLQQHDALMSAQHLQALSQSVTLIEGYLNAYEKNMSPHDLSTDNSDQQELASLKAKFNDSNTAPVADEYKLSIGQLLSADIDGLLNADCTLITALSAENSVQVQADIDKLRTQITRLMAKTSTSTKFKNVLEALDGAYQYLEKNVSAARDPQVQQKVLAGHDQLIGLFDALAGSMSLKVDTSVLEQLRTIGKADARPISEALVETAAPEVRSIQAPDMQLEVVDTDIELLEIFLEEAQDIDNTLADAFSRWGADIGNMTLIKVLQRHLHTIKGGARMAGIGSIGDLTHAAESVYEAFVQCKRTPTLQWYAIMQRVQDTLSLQIDYVKRYQESFFASELVEELEDLLAQQALPTSVCLTLPASQADSVESSEALKMAVSQDAEIEAPNLESLKLISWPNGVPDPDILEVFLEEADELVSSSSKYLQLFLSNISDTVALQALQRDLHTIKGGARMVAASGIADLAHEMETVYEELAIRRRPATKMISQLLVNCHDWLADAVFVLKHQINPDMPSVLIDALQQFSRDPDSLKQVPSASLQTQISAILTAKAEREAIQGNIDISQMPSMSGSFTEQEQNTANNEMIRISGNLIEHMINLSGESAINRARIDMGMSSLTSSIEEMGVTVQRLADQLRRMESELETQILSQIDEDLINTEDFDPLEMDQYSSLNQLSKSLSESASDLVDINSTLLEKTRDSESLLLQLSRTQTELQDGLMNSRMVPFARLTPRLERIVRQTASELNKSVELTIINADDEMDRTILERITSPLEHMLRNAVDHGIESAQARVSASKDRSGHITLEVLREGSEVVIHLSDDGRGINVDAVRNKAIAQGLIDADDQDLSDLDVMQYIFNAGLTTTSEITQISGRGVGMDVVISEIRQLGGVVSVSSVPNQGSRFTIRVPLTVAVSDALVVRAADRNYAIPLAQIERVVRINPEKLYDYYESQAATLTIEGVDYRVRYLNDLLSGNKLNELTVTTNSSLPVIIVKSRSGQRLALQVDQIEGSRIEVVVKPLARQLSHLAGISAATIMGDGSVMLILDLITLLRSAPTLKEINASKQPHLRVDQMSVQPTILVVDDSVTVRKVTSRLLERHGFKAMVAKDGMDAIEILQETTPDLMLLDIEMPRMDGFEVATQVRHNKRLRQIPIIMITSRTGEKHRTRALEAGVNDYMGKPFQEKALLEKINVLLDQTLQQSLGEKNDANNDANNVSSYEG